MILKSSLATQSNCVAESFFIVEIPLGLGIEARSNAQKHVVPFPPFDASCQDYQSIRNTIETFVRMVSSVLIT
jgi:hypothetical protein